MHPAFITLLVVLCFTIVCITIAITVRIGNMRGYCRHVWKIFWQWPPEYKLMEKLTDGRRSRKALMVMVCEKCGATEEHPLTER